MCVVIAAYLGLVAVGVWMESTSGCQSPGPCLFRRVTGHPCPTCGTTRMVVSICRGRIAEAAVRNPLMFVVTALAAGAVVLRVVFARRLVLHTSALAGRAVAAALIIAVLVNWTYLLCME